MTVSSPMARNRNDAAVNIKEKHNNTKAIEGLKPPFDFCFITGKAAISETSADGRFIKIENKGQAVILNLCQPYPPFHAFYQRFLAYVYR